MRWDRTEESPVSSRDRGWLEAEERGRKKRNLIHQARGRTFCDGVATPFFRLFSEWGRLEANYRDKEEEKEGRGEEGREEGRRIGEDGSEPAKLPELSMHPIMEMRPLAALENYVDVMRDTPFFVHPTRPPPRLSPLPSPPLSSPSHPRFNLKTVFGLSRIHKIQLSFSFLPPSLLPLHEETRPRLDSSFLLAGSIMIRLTEQRAFEIRKRRGYSER